MRGNGADDSAAERGSQQGAEPTAAALQITAAGAATAGGGARGYVTAASETNFYEDASRSVGVAGRRGAAVPVEVGPATRGQSDQPGGAGEWGSYPAGELGIGYDMPLPRLALKHNVVPQFSGEKPEFTAWTRDARYYPRGVGFLSDSASDPPQYVPVGEMGTEKTVLVGRGYNRESVHIHALVWNFLSKGLKSKSDKSILSRYTVPKEAWDKLLAWYGTQTTGTKSDISRRLNSFKIAPGSNPLQEMGKIEDLAADMGIA